MCVFRHIAVVAFILGSASAASAADKIELDFKSHLEAGIPEQHVYVERSPGSGDIFRPTPVDQHRYLDAQVFAPVGAVANAPQNKSAVGPYRRGKPLGFTLGEWLAATAKGFYECDDGEANVNVTFENMLPDAVYTVWYVLEPHPLLDPYAALDIPLGARDGSQSVFTTDGKGHADYNIAFSPCLQLGGVQVNALLAAVYHSDGKTYGAQPGAMSDVSHAQIFVVLPTEE